MDSSRDTGQQPRQANQELPLEEIINAALQTRPMTAEEKRALEEEYRQRQRKSPGRKRRQH